MKIPALILSIALSSSFAADWPQWRGLHRDDNSGEVGLLKQWPADGPKRAWLFENAGMGYAGFSVAGGRLFVMGTRAEKEVLIALNALTGKELWASPVGEIYPNNWGDGPRSTPTVDHEHIFAMSAVGNLVCLQVKDGKVLWSKSMKDVGGSTPSWGFTESPLVDGNLVICTPGGDKGTMAAFDKKTGNLVWQSAEITEGAQYASIIPATMGGKKQYVQLVMQTIFSVDPSNGKLLWRSPWAGRTAVIPTPIVKGDEVFVSSGYNVGCKKIKITDGQVTDVFMNRDMDNHHGGVILVGNYLYGHTGKNGWACMDFADGSLKWRSRAIGKGAIGYADGMLYCLDEKTGDIALIEASPAGWNEKGRFRLTPQAANRNPKGGIWVHPVVANGKLYLRDQEYIHCFDVKK